MISTADVVKDVVKSSPFLEEALARRIISYSALARELAPIIEKRLLKQAKRGAIVMALKRITGKIKQTQKITPKLNNLLDLTVRSKLLEFTYANSDTMAEKQRILFSAVEKRIDIFCNLSQGVRQTTFIVGRDIEKELEAIFTNERLVAKIPNLASITIRLPKDAVEIPGVYYNVLKLLAWEGINIIEVVSTYDELTIVLKDKDIDRAFLTLSSSQKTME